MTNGYKRHGSTEKEGEEEMIPAHHLDTTQVHNPEQNEVHSDFSAKVPEMTKTSDTGLRPGSPSDGNTEFFPREGQPGEISTDAEGDIGLEDNGDVRRMPEQPQVPPDWPVIDGHGPVYAADVPKVESKHGGGSYNEVDKYVKREGLENQEKHHMPADSASELRTEDGPCIAMDKADHVQTASWGSSKEAKEYREKQQELIEDRRFREAMQMDIDDIHEKFGDKYDDQIKEMVAYVDKLEEAGVI